MSIDVKNTSMITFIIPTIYKSPHLLQLLRTLENCDLVQEIILVEDGVDVDKQLDKSWFHKLTIIPFTKKLWFNGCVNLGVSLVKTHLYAISNDDILFPTSVIKDCVHHYKLRPKTGVIGMHHSVYHQYPPLLWAIELKTNTLKSEDAGWAALMFNHKDNDIIIPDDLEHYFGDNYMVSYSKYPCMTFYGDKFYTTAEDFSTSTKTYNAIEMEKMFNKEGTAYRKYLRDKPLWETLNPII
tara:strand:+ start:801 stop:1520 length:720 start_codon:yes stop_codon:yes gene_type:complete